MNEKVRLQVLDGSEEHEWGDVGHKAGDLTVPVTSKNKYSINNIDDTTTASVTYIGYEDVSGAWWIKELDETSNIVIGHATIINNSSTTSYSDAWNNRASLNYDINSQAF